jgi:hypothetical protein
MQHQKELVDANAVKAKTVKEKNKKLKAEIQNLKKQLRENTLNHISDEIRSSSSPSNSTPVPVTRSSSVTTVSKFYYNVVITRVYKSYTARNTSLGANYSK